MQIACADPDNRVQRAELAQRAASVLAGGGLVVLPTETLYGLACRADDAEAVGRLRAAVSGGRPSAYSIHLAEPDDAGRYVDLEGRLAVRRLVHRAMPGPVTLLVDQPAEVTRRRLTEAGVPGAATGVLPGDDSKGPVGLRCPDHELTRAVLRATTDRGLVIVAGRAGLRAHDAESAAAAVQGEGGGGADLVLDGGRTRYNQPSTVVHIAASGAVGVRREGVFDQRMIRNMMQFTILMVCTGNTCRSPMAQAIARQMIARRKGVDDADLEAAGVTVLSAGVFAMPGNPATPEAVDALAPQGIDLSRHRSRSLTRELVQRADVIYAMTDAHRDAVLEAAPEAASKVVRLDPDADIDDPIGSDAQAYVQTADHITRALERRLKEQPL